MWIGDNTVKPKIKNWIDKIWSAFDEENKEKTVNTKLQILWTNVCVTHDIDCIKKHSK